ncbi:hypothetical protein NRB56_07980 [Nocardia sp. RB56]|uniref:Uncharacterized protein n=1 Tax=Nocardia aurantia TaxID=2585199 RepID=A0A7K0DJ06_9NOCA|nr:hypothetical protein [Nocardia aurantia]
MSAPHVYVRAVLHPIITVIRRRKPGAHTAI